MKNLLAILLLSVTFSAFSQEDAWVYFVDKPNYQFYFDNPLAMLSQRSLDRRTTQNIALDLKDVPVYQEYIDQITAQNGIEVKAKSKWLNCLHVRGSEESIEALSNLSFVSVVKFADESLNQSNRIYTQQKINSVNKVLDTQTAFAYGNSGNQIQMLNGHLLHQQDFTGSGKIIAVMDAGFPNVNTVAPFERLRDNNQLLGGYNFVARNENFYNGNSHGTLVLSTMGGYIENELVGTAPDSQYYLFITEDVASENPVEESNWVEAAELADSLGVDIINTSLGYFEYDNPNYSHTYDDMTGDSAFMSRGLNIAFSRGMICVASAGNSGNSGNPNVAVPAEAFNAFAIGAVQFDESFATFSSIGPSFDGRVKPDVMAQGLNSVLSNTSGAITTASGTSFSGPIMAGMIASFWQAIPWATNVQVLEFVKQSADKFLNPTPQFGYGIPDFQAALNLALLSVNENIKSNFVLFPNPTHDTITFQSPNNFEDGKISFYNNLGQLVLEKNDIDQSQTIDVSDLISGIYYYNFISENSSSSGKLIKK